jgi:DNA polymerase-3 subunit gamma/tau
MLEVVAELESNGRSLQHFARELARYFRNLLVVKVTGGNARLVAASPTELAQLAETATQFSEEDLTRLLQLSLDVFTSLQNSLQPRLHLEIGLLRMVQAGRLQSIEEALAGLGGAGGTGTAPPKTPPKIPPKTPLGTAEPAPPVQTPASAPQPGGDLRSRLHAALTEAKQLHIADAIEHSEMVESGGELIITTPKMYLMYLKQAEFESAVKRTAGKPLKISIKTGEASIPSITAPVAAPPATVPAPDEVSSRALSNPEVRRFQEMFPESQVRTIRNLREN